MDNEKKIWDTLNAAIRNAYGVAGLMGNLFAESSLNPLCVTGKRGLNGAQYAKDVNDGTIKADIFAHDGIAFGLAQWRYWSRKDQLHLYATGKDIGAADVQLGFLIQEIQTYKTTWNTLLNATTVKEASDIVLIRYEKPANVSDKTKEKRAAFGQGYYDKYAVPVTPKGHRVRTTANAVFLRRGNSRKYEAVGQANTAGTEYIWVATAENGWHAVEAEVNHKKQVVWISGDFSEVI